MDKEKIIERTRLFESLSDAGKAAVGAICTTKTLRKKEILFFEGDRGSSLYVLVEGSIQLYKSSPEGKEIVIKVVKPGEEFAEVVLFEKDEYPVSALALSDSLVYSVPRREFYRLLEDEGFRKDFIGMLIKKMRYLADQIRYLTMHDVEYRLFRFLEDQYGRVEKMKSSLSKKAVAAAVGTTPETLSRVLLRLKQEGKLTWEGSRITIDPKIWDDLE